MKGASRSSIRSWEGILSSRSLANCRSRRKQSRYPAMVCGLACRWRSKRSVKKAWRREEKLAEVMAASPAQSAGRQLVEGAQVPLLGTNNFRSRGRAPNRWPAWEVLVRHRARRDTSGSMCGQQNDDVGHAAVGRDHDTWRVRASRVVGTVLRRCSELYFQ